MALGKARKHEATLGRLTLAFLRIGNTTFGGGDPTIAALRLELVERRGWLDRLWFEMANGLARVTPGTNMLAFCAGAAWAIAGWPAAVLAVLAVTVPSAVLVILLTAGYESWKTNPSVMAAVHGTLAAAVGMMLSAAWLLVRPHLLGASWLRAAVIAGASAAAMMFTPASPLQILAVAAAISVVWQGKGR